MKLEKSKKLSDIYLDSARWFFNMAEKEDGLFGVRFNDINGWIALFNREWELDRESAYAASRLMGDLKRLNNL